MTREQLLDHADRAAVWAGFTAAERLQMREALSNPNVVRVARMAFYTSGGCGCPLTIAGFVSHNADHTDYVYSLPECDAARFAGHFDGDTDYVSGLVIEIEA